MRTLPWVLVTLSLTSLAGFAATSKRSAPVGHSHNLQQPAKAKHPAPKRQTPKPAPTAKVATESASLQSGDALIESVGMVPELQGDALFTNSINWTKRIITVLGVGVSPDRGILAVRRKVAESFALDDGLRQLADVVSKVRVNADATVGDLVVADDDLQGRVNACIATAKISDNQVLPDGSVQLKLQLPLFGKDGLAGAVLADEPSSILFAAEATASLPVTQWTGVVLDARGVGAQPALAPSIRSVDGKGFADRPPVAYLHSAEGAADLAGDHPLKVAVKRATGNTHSDLLISVEDIQKIKASWAKSPLSLVILI